MNKISVIKIKVPSLCLLLLSFLLGSILYHPHSSSQSFTIQEFPLKNEVSIELYSDLWESAWVRADAAGWINGRAEFHSRDLGFGDLGERASIVAGV